MNKIMDRKKKKILLLTKIFPPKVGGIPNYYFNLIRNVSAVDITVLTELRPVSPELEEVRRTLAAQGVHMRVSRLFPENMSAQCAPSWFVRLALFTGRIIRLVLAERIDYVVVGQAQMFLTLAAYVCGVCTGRPYVVFLHGEDIPLIPLKSLEFLRFLFGRSAFYLCNTNFTVDKLQRFLGVGAMAGKKTVICTPAVEDKFFVEVSSSQIAALKEKLGLSKKKIVYTISRFDVRKGQDKVLEAFPAVLREFPDAVYLLGGEGPDLDRILSLVKRYSLDNYVKYVGMVPHDELVLYHAIGDVFVMPNRVLEDGDSEGFGIVFLEANAVGKPVIAGRSGGAVDAVVDGETGYLVDPNSHEAIACSIRDLLRDPVRAARMGTRGRERTWNEFRWGRIGGIFEKAFLPAEDA